MLFVFFLVSSFQSIALTHYNKSHHMMHYTIHFSSLVIETELVAPVLCSLMEVSERNNLTGSFFTAGSPSAPQPQPHWHEAQLPPVALRPVSLHSAHITLTTALWQKKNNKKQKHILFTNGNLLLVWRWNTYCTLWCPSGGLRGVR